MADIFIKRGNSSTDMHRDRTPHENEDRDWGDAAEDKETAQIASKPQKRERDLEQIRPHILQGGTKPVDTLLSEF